MKIYLKPKEFNKNKKIYNRLNGWRQETVWIVYIRYYGKNYLWF